MRMKLGVGVRLSLALLALVLAALAIVYLLVIPDLEDRLLEDRQRELERTAQVFVRAYRPGEFQEGPLVAAAAAAANARALVLQEFSLNVLGVFQDSAGASQPLAFAKDPVALRAFESGALSRGVVRRGETRYVEVAAPLPPDGSLVLVLSASAQNSLGIADVVERRLLTAGALALLAAVVLGFAAATLHARRIRRLQRAADRIAHGRFDEPVVDDGADELRELADSFERMRRRLASLDHARREFVANASHELRTPIFALGAALELLDDEDLDEPTRRDFVATAREQVDRLTRLAGDLLDLSRLDAGRMSFEPKAVDLGEAAGVLAEEFAATGRTQGRPILLEHADGVTALADRDQVLRIGRVLLENALLHTPAGTNVRIRAEARNGSAALAVADDGPGIPPEHVERIFDRFYRVDGTRARGSGLGLAIARELAELMGGSLEAVSSDGATTFVLVLPGAPPRAFSREDERVFT